MRVFVAVDIPEDVKDSISQLYAELSGLEARIVERKELHITMNFIGEVNDKKIDDISEAISSVKEKRFEVSVEGLGAFTPQQMRTIYVGITKGAEELVRIQKQLSDALSEIGIEPEEREFVPHITIARTNSARNKFELMNFLKDNGGRSFGTFTVQGISLKKSDLTQKGPIYTTIYENKLALL